MAISYSIPGALDLEALDSELRASGLADFAGVMVHEGALLVEFDGADPVDTSALDALIAAHTGAPLPYLAIYDLIPAADLYRPVDSINYITGLAAEVGRLHPIVEDMTDGEVRRVVHYLNFDGVTPSFPIVEERYTYNRNPLGFAMSRVMEIQWYQNDGALGDLVKTRLKIYSYQDAIRESKRKRSNIVDALELEVLGLMQATVTEAQAIAEGWPSNDEASVLEMGRAFLVSHEGALYSYEHADNKAIQADILADVSRPWLDNPINGDGVTLRAYIVSKFV